MLITSGYLTEADCADPQKINDALTLFAFREAYKDAIGSMPKCIAELLREKLNQTRLHD